MSRPAKANVSKRVTVYDVAKEAGVSAQTVSRVINNQGYISDKSRTLVSAAVDKLGYVPNRAAQMLHTRTSNTLEIITFGNSPFKFQGPFTGMVTASQDLGYHLSFAMSPEEEVTEALNSIVSRLIDGIIFIDVHNKLGGNIPEQLQKTIPYVFLGQPHGFKGPAVSYDHRHGARLAVEHLVDLGHMRIAEIRGPLNDIDATERHQMWLELADEVGLEPHLVEIGDYTYKSGYTATLNLLALDDTFTAVLVANDSMAVGAMKAIAERGLNVPEDVSIVGYDDAAHAAYVSPSLTTVAQDFDELGRESIKYLVERVQNPSRPVKHRLLKPEFVIRESTAKVS
ncbi:MAG: LacI family DNA-binding transcriptional regulator [Deinococcota bacterium]